MKTTIVEDKSEPVAPVVPEFPALYKYVNPGHSCHGEIAVFMKDGSGVTICSLGQSYPMGYHYKEKSDRFSSEDFKNEWHRLTAPITITFDPTK